MTLTGTEDDIRTPRDYRHRAVARNGSINVNDSQRGNSSQQRGGEELNAIFYRIISFLFIALHYSFLFRLIKL